MHVRARNLELSLRFSTRSSRFPANFAKRERERERERERTRRKRGEQSGKLDEESRKSK
jgi:hypothetical protein